MEADILEEIEKTVEFDVPEGLLEEQKRLHDLRLQYKLIQEGKPKEEIEAELKKREQPAEDEIRREIKRFFILEKIAEEEKIFATEDDVDERIQLYSRAYQKRPIEVARELDESGRLDELRTEIRHAKVRELLRKKAKVIGAAGNGGATAERPKREPKHEEGAATTSPEG